MACTLIASLLEPDSQLFANRLVEIPTSPCEFRSALVAANTSHATLTSFGSTVGTEPSVSKFQSDDGIKA